MKGFAQPLGLVAIVLIVVGLILAQGMMAPPIEEGGHGAEEAQGENIETTQSTPVPVQSDLKKFDTWENVVSFLSTQPQGGLYGGRMMETFTVTKGVAAPMAAPAAANAESAATDSSSGAAGATDYSTTNIQVEGVDEADIMKNDGKYIYAISNGNIIILQAYPASEMKVLSVLNQSAYANIFINGDKLVAFGSEQYKWDPIVKPLESQFAATVKCAAGARCIMPPYYPQSSSQFIKIYDISDRSSPKEIKATNLKGDYVAARMIGPKIYGVFSEYASPSFPRPLYAVDGIAREIAPAEINYFDVPFESHQFVTLLGFDLNNLEKEESRKIVLMGYTQNIYVSPENAYITYTSQDNYVPQWPVYGEIIKPVMAEEYLAKVAAVDASDVSEWRKDSLKVSAAQDFLQSLDEKKRNELYQNIYEKQLEIAEKNTEPAETTQIHKFVLGEEITYAGKGEVPGHLLNQFSMDENKGYFRLATTLGEVWDSQTPSKNNIYVLDSSLKTVGKLEGLAPGEKIYSARFMGNRAYLVTFKKVDPLFVIGLEDPAAPKMLGKLKIPGYSDYLHPYDENHLIGLGKDAVDAMREDEVAGRELDFAWYQGVKLSLFDVSDVSTPKELATYSIGDRGTESYALQDHKAFLFSKDKGLLVIPIRLAEINKAKYPNGVDPQTYGDFTFQGAYVFNVGLEGFKLKGRVSHASAEDLEKSGEYYWGQETDVLRSLYMDSTLYTVSEKFVKANSLDTLAEEGSVELPYEETRFYPEPMIEPMIAVSAVKVG
ncbi:beta-propeller domain-containing protein [Candidatus Micrarchaeota archaeon]|nr:beta-propeller domain-containing protein [Candidatus Micrarchaeota archaeon]